MERVPYARGSLKVFKNISYFTDLLPINDFTATSLLTKNSAFYNSPMFFSCYITWHMLNFYPVKIAYMTDYMSAMQIIFKGNNQPQRIRKESVIQYSKNRITIEQQSLSEITNLTKFKPLLMVLYRKYDSAYKYPKALYKADNLSATNWNAWHLSRTLWKWKMLKHLFAI